MKPNGTSLRRRFSRFLRRYSYGTLALTLAAFILFWHLWEKPRPQHIHGSSTFILKPPPLSTMPVTLHIEGKSLRAVVEDLAQQCRVPLDFQQKELEGAGIDGTLPVKLEHPPTGPIPLQSALNLISKSDQFGATFFDIEPNRIVCSSRDGLASQSRNIHVLYNIADLVALRSPYERQNNDLTENLKQMIIFSVQPEYWFDLGGKTASIAEDGHSNLEIDAPPSMHYMIQQLFDQLRQQR